MRRYALHQNPSSRRIGARSERSVGQLRSAGRARGLHTIKAGFDSTLGRARGASCCEAALGDDLMLRHRCRHAVPRMMQGRALIGTVGDCAGRKSTLRFREGKSRDLGAISGFAHWTSNSRLERRRLDKVPRVMRPDHNPPHHSAHGFAGAAQPRR